MNTRIIWLFCGFVAGLLCGVVLHFGPRQRQTAGLYRDRCAALIQSEGHLTALPGNQIKVESPNGLLGQWRPRQLAGRPFNCWKSRFILTAGDSFVERPNLDLQVQYRLVELATNGVLLRYSLTRDKRSCRSVNRAVDAGDIFVAFSQ